MGQRVSLPSCVNGGCSTVRVQKPCGKFEEVESPCVAAKVMGKHPEYLVVHCSFYNGHAIDITVISPNQPLLPGVPYMLYPKVESAGEPGGEVRNIPGSMCMSMKDRQVTFRSLRSPNSMSRKESWKSISRKGSTRSSDEKAKSSPQH